MPLNAFFEMNPQFGRVKSEVALNDKYLLLSAYAVIMCCLYTQDAYGKRKGDVGKYDSKLERNQELLLACYEGVFKVRNAQCLSLV